MYWAGALPCLAAEAALALWLSAQLGRRGCGLGTRVAAVAVCVANPLAVSALQDGHPEELLGAVLCVAAVLCAQRDRPVWSGVLIGLAIANKDWGILAVGPALLALRQGHGRAILAMVATAGPLFAPFVRGRPGRRRRDAMLLLALLLLLRCVLGSWDAVYYPLPFLTALLAWETAVSDAVPRPWPRRAAPGVRDVGGQLG
ncbi:MAG: glycosyltransferase 87 family protein [Solirubrobacteraceae bacterium]